MLIPPIILWIVLASPPEESLALAARCQEQGRYAVAAALYDLLEPRHPTAGEFYLNQGNAHFLAGNLPRAILAYRRAAARMPSNSTVRENLAEARSHVVDPEGIPNGWQLHRYAPGVYAFAWGLLIIWIMRPRRRLLLFAGATLAGALFLFGWSAYAKWDEAHHPLAVVVGDVTLRKGNGVSYAPVETHLGKVRLSSGVEARALAARPNGWVQIELASGVVGWAPREALLLDHELP
jgi:tetratricopeptide (TPR) repeat protein